MGSLGSGQHLNTSIGILLALAQDTNCSSIRVTVNMQSNKTVITFVSSHGPYFHSPKLPSPEAACFCEINLL
jgi:hypothetical protein